MQFRTNLLVIRTYILDSKKLHSRKNYYVQNKNLTSAYLLISFFILFGVCKQRMHFTCSGVVQKTVVPNFVTTHAEIPLQIYNETLQHFTNSSSQNTIPTGNYMFKVNNRNTRTRCEICSKLTIKTPERR